MDRIGLVTSGGDAPGMNAAIRAVTRVSCSKLMEVLGFERGWDGIISNKFRVLTPRNVGGILHIGGTILRTSRSPEFRTPEGLNKAAENLAANGVEGLIVVGGDGSMKGALALSEVSDIAVIGIPATIDNDVYGTEESIGFDTAVNTAINEIDKIRDTANAHERIFVVEVMGRNRGFLALNIGLTVGAEIILVPEVEYDAKTVAETLKLNRDIGKKSGIIVAAEGIGDTRKLITELETMAGVDVRLSVMGYAQRGGNPSARSRLLANLFADKAVDLLKNGERNKMVALQNGRVTTIGLHEVTSNQKQLDLYLMQLAQTLAI
ncbi:MAG: ATP-dependent 6-phosphofructokinase [Candidatus Bathyarchaeota archaeon]|nr:ATP-dependent 6-phosphofructokinase [Candidatus Bathyarchaeum tardum]